MVGKFVLRALQVGVLEKVIRILSKIFYSSALTDCTFVGYLDEVEVKYEA